MAGTFAYIQTQPLSFAQKLVQARVYAQGLTLAALVGMAGITQIPSAGDKILRQKKEADKHSWMEYIPKEGDGSDSSSSSSSGGSNGSGSGEGAAQGRKVEDDKLNDVKVRKPKASSKASETEHSS